MTRTEYLYTLKCLGLTPASRATAAALGVSVRQVMRYAAGAPIPRRVECLLGIYARCPRLLRQRTRAALASQAK